MKRRPFHSFCFSVTLTKLVSCPFIHHACLHGRFGSIGVLVKLYSSRPFFDKIRDWRFFFSKRKFKNRFFLIWNLIDKLYIKSMQISTRHRSTRNRKRHEPSSFLKGKLITVEFWLTCKTMIRFLFRIEFTNFHYILPLTRFADSNPCLRNRSFDIIVFVTEFNNLDVAHSSR